MLRYALRRIFWTVPVLFGVTLALFALLSVSRAPDSQPLPAFINLHPRDVRALSHDAVARIASNPDDADAKLVLVRLGGAALPFVLPQLDSLDPASREQVALALTPVAARMGLLPPHALRSGPEAVTFWTLYWQERSVDYRPGVVRRAVRRLASQGSDARRNALLELDTYVLGEVMDALGEVSGPPDVARVSRLLDVASHVTGRDDRIGPDAAPLQARACVNRWHEWWLASRTDFELLSGPSRIAAMLVETRYGHWALRALTMKLGTARDGQLLVEKLLLRAPLTLGLTIAGLLLANVLGIGGALIVSWSKRRWLDRFTLVVAVLALSLPFPAVVLAIARVSGGRALAACAIVAIVVAFVGSPLRHQRLAVLEASVREVVRYARARGVSTSSLLLRHTLRPTLAAVLPLIALDFPLAVSCACAAEKALGLRGISGPVIRAVLDRDVSLLMAVGIGFTAIAGLMHLATDLVSVWLDPRTQRRVLQDRAT